MGKLFTNFKKKLIPFLTIVFLVSAVGFLIADQSKVVMVGGGQAHKALDDFLMEGEIIGGVAGDSWYVDSGKTASGDGKSWDYAVITWNEAIDLCTADNGDVIHVAPNHGETITSATIVVADVDGITTIGYGEGLQRPTFTWATGTGASIPVSGADFVVKNMIFDGSSDVATVAMFTVTGAGFQLVGSEIVTGDAGDQAVLVITGDADADRMKVLGCHFTGSTDTGSTAAISFSAGATDIEIAYNVFKGDYSSAAIASASAILEVNIHHNYIYNFNNGNHAIEISSNTATGVIAYNHLVTDVFASGLDSGGLDVIETYWSDDEVDDVMATAIFTHEDGNVLWSATERAILETEANDALVDENLDHFVKAAAGGSTTAYPSDVTDYSILAYIMAQDGAVADFDEDTDSLEAISDKITTGTDTLSGIQLDHFVYAAAGGSTTAYPSNVTDYSILAYIMAQDGAVADYDEDTDSLEALGIQVADTNLELMANNALVDEGLDYFVKVAAGGSTTAYPSNVTAFSQLGYILGIDGDSTGYDEATDSLEALGDQVDSTNLELMANNALVDEGLDHMITAASGGGTTAYPDNVTQYSVVSYILGIDADPTGFDEATDSLEALGDDTDAIIVDTEDIQDMMARCVARGTDTLPQTATKTIFTVATGPIRVLELVGEVTTVLGATVTNLQVGIDPTTGAASVMATDLPVTDDLDGSFMTLTGAFGSILVNTATGGAAGMSVPYIVPIGIITITTDASITGSIAWMIRYEPLASGAAVTATGP